MAIDVTSLGHETVNLNADISEAGLNGTGPSIAEFEEQEEGFNRTDAGNAKRLVSLFGDRLRYVPQWGFMWYDGIKWKAVDDVFVQGLSKQTLASMEDEAVQLRKSTDKAERERGTRLEAWVLACEFNSHIRNMGLLSRDLVLAETTDFDTDGLLINMLDCTLDVRTGKTHEHRSSDMLTRVTGAAYYVESNGSRFLQFLDEIFGGNVELKQYAQEVFGYAMTDVTREEHFWLAHGAGANGKTTLYETTATAMGDYAVVGRIDMIIEQKLTRKDFDLPTMVGARRVTFKETKPGQKLNEDMIKGLTDGSSTLTEEKFKKPFRFKPHFKMHLHTNDLPTTQDVGLGLWRRLRVIPFKECFENKPGCHKPDTELEAKLNQELPAILRWLVDGAVMWYQNGLHEPEIVKIATQSYQQDNDPIDEWMQERTVKVASDERINGQHLYSNYEDWYKGPYNEKLDYRVFGKLLKSKGYDSKRSNGVTWYYGIAINEDVETELDRKIREHHERTTDKTVPCDDCDED